MKKVRIIKTPGQALNKEIFNKNLHPDKLQKKKTRVKKYVEEVPEDWANIEAERGETFLGDYMGQGIPQFLKIGGKPHSRGGTKMAAPDGYVFSRYKPMTFRDPLILESFGVNKPMVPADISKKYDFMDSLRGLYDPMSDDLQKKTYEMNIANSINKLGKLALTQEAFKGFPDGIPTAAIPYLNKMGMNPGMFIDNKEENAEDMPEDDSQAMQQEGYAALGGTMSSNLPRFQTLGMNTAQARQMMIDDYNKGEPPKIVPGTSAGYLPSVPTMHSNEITDLYYPKKKDRPFTSYLNNAKKTLEKNNLNDVNNRIEEIETYFPQVTKKSLSLSNDMSQLSDVYYDLVYKQKQLKLDKDKKQKNTDVLSDFKTKHYDYGKNIDSYIINKNKEIDQVPDISTRFLLKGQLLNLSKYSLKNRDIGYNVQPIGGVETWGEYDLEEKQKVDEIVKNIDSTLKQYKSQTPPKKIEQQPVKQIQDTIVNTQQPVKVDSTKVTKVINQEQQPQKKQQQQSKKPKKKVQMLFKTGGSFRKVRIIKHPKYNSGGMIMPEDYNISMYSNPFLDASNYNMPQMKKGGSTLRRFDNGGDTNSWIKKILDYESSKGSASGSGLSNYGIKKDVWESKYPEMWSDNKIDEKEAIDFIKKEYLPKVQDYPEDVQKRLVDYAYNTGRNIEDVLLLASGKKGLEDIQTQNTDFDLFNKEKTNIIKNMSSPEFIKKIDSAKHDILKDTWKRKGNPDAYEKSSKGRIDMWGEASSNKKANANSNVNNNTNSNSNANNNVNTNSNANVNTKKEENPNAYNYETFKPKGNTGWLPDETGQWAFYTDYAKKQIDKSQGSQAPPEVITAWNAKFKDSPADKYGVTPKYENRLNDSKRKKSYDKMISIITDPKNESMLNAAYEDYSKKIEAYNNSPKGRTKPLPLLDKNGFLDVFKTGQMHTYALSGNKFQHDRWDRNPNRNEAYNQAMKQFGLTAMDEPTIRQFQAIYHSFQDLSANPNFKPILGQFKFAPLSKDRTNMRKGFAVSDIDGVFGDTSAEETVMLSEDIPEEEEKKTTIIEDKDEDETPRDEIETEHFYDEYLPTPPAEEWLQDKMMRAYNLRGRARAEKLQPEVFSPDVYLVNPTMYDPTAEAQQIGSYATTGAQQAAQLGDPQQFGANYSAIMGKAASNIANTLGRYNNMNVGVANQFENINANLLNRYSNIRAANATDLSRQKKILDQQWINEQNQWDDKTTRDNIQALTNAAQTDVMNSMYPQFAVDPSTGGFRPEFLRGRPMKPGSTQTAADVWRDINNIRRSDKDMTISEAIKIYQMSNPQMAQNQPMRNPQMYPQYATGPYGGGVGYGQQEYEDQYYS